MKKLALLLCALLLSGCKVDHVKIQDGITNELIKMTEYEPIYYTTMEKPLYSYYLPKDVGRISSNELSSLFVKDGIKFIMNFNPNKVVIHDYYYKDKVVTAEELTVNEESNLYYDATGTFKGSDKRYHYYDVKVTHLKDNNYLLKLDMSYVNYLAVVKPVEIKPLMKSMFTIAKSIHFDADYVVSEYSLKSTSESVKVSLEEFNEELPESGLLSDLIEKKEGNK